MKRSTYKSYVLLLTTSTPHAASALLLVAPNLLPQDRHRSFLEFAEGQSVYSRLSFARHKFVQGRSLIENLSAHYYGPFQIVEKLRPVTYHLQLLATTHACDIFRVSLLRLSLFPDEPCDPLFPTDPKLFLFLPAVQVRVVLRRRLVQFLVQWHSRRKAKAKAVLKQLPNYHNVCYFIVFVFKLMLCFKSWNMARSMTLLRTFVEFLYYTL
ncbi:hypothetical protein O6H91_15G067900 [Diphasiastrum complanatum]|uniref:Uncharacterized protein n=1 Tax=Diphasiastrum complanatum TaxID=34168 RepID=A0ACC2BJC1_DIPCM|nr:hypothetical protein O6H91_15G067900 [Diphasiastrum complanatum]